MQHKRNIKIEKNKAVSMCIKKDFNRQLFAREKEE
jgi:hypothetical protein